MWSEALVGKHAYRFLRVHPKPEPHRLYSLIKKDIRKRKLFMNTIKLLAFPEFAPPEECSVCHQQFTDTVAHYVTSCQELIPERTQLWTRTLDCITCANEADFISMEDEDQLDILLSKDCKIFQNTEEYDNFSTAAAEELTHLMFIV